MCTRGKIPLQRNFILESVSLVLDSRIVLNFPMVVQSLYYCVRLNLSIVDTIGTQLAVLYREVSLIQR